MENLEEIIKSLTDEVVITSTGYINRKVYALKDRDRNFYMLGSLGMALAIGLGIALNRPDLTVVVISGDGACLMNLGSLVLHNRLGLPNLKHYIIDNGCYESTGGQPTCGAYVDFESLAPNTKVILEQVGQYPRIPLTPKQISERFRNAILPKQEKQEV